MIRKCLKCKVRPIVTCENSHTLFFNEPAWFYQCPKCGKKGSQGYPYSVELAHRYILKRWNEKNKPIPKKLRTK